MKLTRVIAFGVIAASLGLGVVHAQSFSPMDSPAEFPPASYKGKQYVDSRGCVYIRAGIDGSVAWVPRVTRDRKVVCGFKPTFDKPVAGTAPPPKIDKNVVQIQPATAPTEGTTIFGSSTGTKATTSSTATKKATATSTTKTKTKPKTTTSSASAAPATQAAPRQTGLTISNTSQEQPLYTTPVAVPPTAKKKSTASAPTVIAPAAPTTTTTTTTAPTTRRTGTQPARSSGSASPCRGGVSTYKGLKVRCGPQTELPYTPGSGSPTAAPPKMRFNQQNSSLRRPPVGTVVRVGDVGGDVRVVPKHVYEANLVNNVETEVPEGYRLAFDDGRLNARRAEMTFNGKAQSDAIWTRKLPRRLIPRSVESGPVVVARNSGGMTADVAAPVVSSRSAPSEKSIRLTGTPYVQVATYGSAREAQAAAKKIRKLGLPVLIGKVERAGSVQRMVLAGPFEDQAAADAALRSAQGAGYGGAFLRK